MLHVVEVRYERDYTIGLRFNDGAEGLVDLSGELYGLMFAPLQGIDRFRSLRVDGELGTVVWDNGAGFAPEFLYARLLVPSARTEPTR